MPQNANIVRLKPKARADFEQSWWYTAAHWSVAQADIYDSKIVAVMTAPADGTLTGRSAAHIRADTLKYPAGAHILFFQQDESGIEVVRILHAQMDIEQRLEDD